MESSSSVLWLACGITGSVVLYLYKQHRSNSSFRPLPGPKRWPVIGSVPYFPQTRWPEAFTEMQKTYGDVIYFDLMGQPFLVLNSLHDAEELFNKRSNIYSNRPVHQMVTVLMDFGWNLLMRQPGKAFDEQRKLYRKALGPNVLSQYDHWIEEEAEHLVARLHGFVGDPFDTLLRSISEPIVKLSYGETMYKAHGQELADLNIAFMRHITPVFTTFYAVTTFPWLRYIPGWVPGANFQEVARIGKERSQRIRDWPWEMVTRNIADGTADASLVSQFFNSPDISNQNVKEVVSTVYTGAVDTTASACDNFLYEMVANPRVQRKIQQEIEEIVGLGQTVTVAACLEMPYLQAAWKESMRCHPPGILGVPHTNSQDDVWKGYYIPKGTIINANIGFMMRDPRVWGEDADTFRPERFLEDNRKELPDFSSVPFGFGRRICPGRWFAERLGMCFVATILARYTVTEADGETLPNPMPFYDDAIRHPSAFRCQFKHRN